MPIAILTARRPCPPPLWFVTNGEITVGPVRTGLLLRGVLHGRVPAECHVRELRWRGFRPLDEIREISALRRDAPASFGVPLGTAARTSNLLVRASDRSEVLLIGLQAALSLTSSSAGLLHIACDGHFVTRYACGTLSYERLGARVSNADPVIAWARRGGMVLDAPETSELARNVHDRLSHGRRRYEAVAMVPLCGGDRLVGVLELGRSDHAFRASDGVELVRLANAVAEHYVAY
jgi:hypothetical protein